MVVFGQIVIGSPGAGKTTYCKAMSQFLKAIGREVIIVNIDPANEQIPYKADIDISELIQLEEVMEHFKLGPNGALVYCMEFLEKNIDWLMNKIKKIDAGKKYILIDCPGQVELYTHNNAIHSIVQKLEKNLTRLCAVNLIDAHYCSDPSKFVAVCLTSLNSMMRIELPHINILSKADLIEKYGKLDFDIDFYTEVLDLNYLVEMIPDDPFMAKHKKLTKAITELVQDYGLVHFLPLSVDSKEMMLNVKNNVDKANGYCFGTTEEERNLQALMSTAFGAGADVQYGKTSEVREKFLDNDLDKIDIDPDFQV